MLYWKHKKSTFPVEVTVDIEEIEIKKPGEKNYKVDELSNDEEKGFSWLEVTEINHHLT